MRVFMPFARNTALAMTAALALAACGDSDEGVLAGEAAEPIETVAAPEGAAWSDTVVVTDEGGYRMGNPDAPIRLIEYASLTCSHCAAFEDEAFEPLIENYVNSGRVSFEMRNYSLNPYDIPASILTRCGDASAYFPLTQQMFQNQNIIFEGAQQADEAQLEAAMQLPEERRWVEFAQLIGLVQFFQERGISADQAAACLAKPENAQQLINMNQVAVEKFDVNSTPTFVINGTKIDYSGWPALETRLKELGAR